MIAIAKEAPITPITTRIALTMAFLLTSEDFMSVLRIIPNALMMLNVVMANIDICDPRVLITPRKEHAVPVNHSAW